MKIVISGGPGTGKTSIINELVSIGQIVFHESSREIINQLNNLIKNFRDNNLIFPVKFKEFSYLLDKDNISRTSCVTLPMEAFLKAFKDSQ